MFCLQGWGPTQTLPIGNQGYINSPLPTAEKNKVVARVCQTLLAGSPPLDTLHALMYLPFFCGELSLSHF